jgi:hypothetical protein
MLANILGSLLFMLILGVGDAIAMFVLSRSGVSAARVGGSSATVDIRKLAPIIVGLSIVAGAIVGWFAGPIIFEAVGLTL